MLGVLSAPRRDAAGRGKEPIEARVALARCACGLCFALIKTQQPSTSSDTLGPGVVQAVTAFSAMPHDGATWLAARSRRPPSSRRKRKSAARRRLISLPVLGGPRTRRTSPSFAAEQLGPGRTCSVSALDWAGEGAPKAPSCSSLPRSMDRPRWRLVSFAPLRSGFLRIEAQGHGPDLAQHVGHHFLVHV